MILSVNSTFCILGVHLKSRRHAKSTAEAPRQRVPGAAGSKSKEDGGQA